MRRFASVLVLFVALLIHGLLLTEARAVPFDVITVKDVMFDSHLTQNLRWGGWGLVVATDETISVADLAAAEFNYTCDNPNVTVNAIPFDYPDSWAPVQPGEAIGFGPLLYNDLFEPGEFRKTPAGTPGMNFGWSIGFVIPNFYDGDATIDSVVTIGDQSLAYSTSVAFRPIDGSVATVYEAQRIESVPEPSSLILAAIGLGAVCAFVWRRRRVG